VARGYVHEFNGGPESGTSEIEVEVDTAWPRLLLRAIGAPRVAITAAINDSINEVGVKVGYRFG